MIPTTERFRFDYFGTDLVYGRGCLEELGEYLARRGYKRALVVCGRHVGDNEAVMEPLRNGLGDRLSGVFDETTPEKLAGTVYDGIDAMRSTDVDVLVGVGGGSSLDIARQMSVFAADGRSLASVRAAAREGNQGLSAPEGSATPVIVVPTTFAGADMSDGGSIEVISAVDSPTGQPIRASGSIMPEAVLYDPRLFDTTPKTALAGSAMNGFDKGIETAYAPDATPITDATATRGLRLLQDALPRLGDTAEAMDRAVQGTVLVQFRRRGSIVHAFGHGLSQRYDVQQGVVHAIVVPHVLRYVFEKVHARREVIAEGLGIDVETRSDPEIAEEIVTSIVTIRDDLDVPTRLAALEPVEKEDFPAIARFMLDDHMMRQAPEGLDPTVEEIEAVLEAAW